MSKKNERSPEKLDKGTTEVPSKRSYDYLYKSLGVHVLGEKEEGGRTIPIVAVERLLSDEEVEAQFTPQAAEVFRRRYQRKDENGEPVESIADVFYRVARHVALNGEQANGESKETAEQWVVVFRNLMETLRFLPNSPTFTGAGTPLGQLAACFYLPIEDDMGRIEGGIFQTLRDAALIQQTGGGNGFSFSRLRPRNTIVKSSMGKATGPIGFLHVYDKAFGEIAQGGTRRGANMGVLRVDHPDIEEFIEAKSKEGELSNFNLSVGMLDAFMEAVEKDEMWPLRFPDVLHPKYRNFHGTLEEAEKAGIPIKTYQVVRARDLFRLIAEHAWRNGEPGVLFLDTANRENPVPHIAPYEGTNPCGEQFLTPYESCCLGSINLARHLKEDGTMDWDKLKETIYVAVRFLDDVIDSNGFVPGVPQVEQAAKRTRRIGLGIMGLADVLYAMGLRYGSREAQRWSMELMAFIRFHAMRASTALSLVRGPFPAIKGSVYDKENFRWQPPKVPEFLEGKTMMPHFPDEQAWQLLIEDIRAVGIRNAATLTIAPTGTLSTVSGVEGYGCEPVFALGYTRYVHEAEGLVPLRYVSRMFEAALDKAIAEGRVDSSKREEILAEVEKRGSCQGIDEIPADIRHVFVVGSDIPAEEHVMMQAALQVFVDSSISKTISMPHEATVEDVERAYMLAWKYRCKGLTVYRQGSRQHEVLKTAKSDNSGKDEDKGAGGQGGKEEKATEHAQQLQLSSSSAPSPVSAQAPVVLKRPEVLSGKTYRIPSPVGNVFVTVNEQDGEPFEVFVLVGKAGSEITAGAEAMGRLISLTLRLNTPMSRHERFQSVIEQIRRIGGTRTHGFGHERVLSLPDAIARALTRYLEERDGQSGNDNSPATHTHGFLALNLNLGSSSASSAGAKAASVAIVTAGEDGNEDNAMSSSNDGSPSHTAEKKDADKGGKTGEFDICPQCGNPTLRLVEGCSTCIACGYSACG